MDLINQMKGGVGMVFAITYNAIVLWVLFVPDLDGKNNAWAMCVASGIALICSLSMRLIKPVRDFFMEKGYDEQTTLINLNFPVFLWSILFPAALFISFGN